MSCPSNSWSNFAKLSNRCAFCDWKSLPATLLPKGWHDCPLADRLAAFSQLQRPRIGNLMDDFLRSGKNALLERGYFIADQGKNSTIVKVFVGVG